ncbi:MAG: hypothetical protein IKE45_01880 [Halomonas sp.]|nr:hypothetical protein [Halomonas sp.]MBR2512767.1 hypothetical protein [Halomonas sp.]
MKRLILAAALCSAAFSMAAQANDAEYPIFSIEDACGWSELAAGNQSESEFITCVEEQRKAGSRVGNIWYDYPEEKRRECFHEAYRGASGGDYGVDGGYKKAEACLLDS